MKDLIYELEEDNLCPHPIRSNFYRMPMPQAGSHKIILKLWEYSLSNENIKR